MVEIKDRKPLGFIQDGQVIGSEDLLVIQRGSLFAQF